MVAVDVGSAVVGGVVVGRCCCRYICVGVGVGLGTYRYWNVDVDVDADFFVDSMVVTLTPLCDVDVDAVDKRYLLKFTGMPFFYVLFTLILVLVYCIGTYIGHLVLNIDPGIDNCIVADADVVTTAAIGTCDF